MRVFVQRASFDGKKWRIRFCTAGTSAFAGDLVTTVILGSRTTLLPDALNNGAKRARENFEEMRDFNRASEAHS